MKRSAFAVLAIALAAAPAGAQTRQPNLRELNGFLIGQYLSAIENSFDEPLETQQTDDDWLYKAFVVDREHRAYMVFKFPPDEPRRAYSVQIAGDAGTEMLPFKGLRLGASGIAVRSALGEPSEIRYLEDLDLELYLYEGNNYSVEINAEGRLSSIMIHAVDPSSAVPTDLTIETIASVLAGRDIDRILEVVTSDLDIVFEREYSVLDGGAREFLADTTNTLARALYADPNSLAEVLQREDVMATAARELRIFETGNTAWVYKFGANTPLAEVVLFVDEGAWRMWEVRFRD